MNKPYAARVPKGLDDRIIDLDEVELNVESANVTGVTLPEHNLSSYLDITESRVKGVAFTGLHFEDLSLTDTVFEDCEFSGAIMNEASMVRVQFQNCRMTGVVASQLKGRDVTFDNCRLDGAHFRMGKLTRAQFRNCELHDADFGEAELTDVAFQDSRLGSTSFNNVRIDQMSLFGCELEKLRGVEFLRGASITDDQVQALAYPVFTALGINIED